MQPLRKPLLFTTGEKPLCSQWVFHACGTLQSMASVTDVSWVILGNSIIHMFTALAMQGDK
jgi:hypothetical protein